jgi:enoyl-CoA hydratase/carnithine racemase
MDLYEGEFASLQVIQEGQVATIKMMGAGRVDPVREVDGKGSWDLGEVLGRLRGNNEVRVVVLTGFAENVFKRPPPSDGYASRDFSTLRNDPKHVWMLSTGITRVLEGLLTIEKPVVAKVNGDAIGFGQSVMFACDLILAREDVRIIDHHLDNGESGRGAPYGLVPGDGGPAFAPSYFSPARAKEYLMLSRVYTGAELAAMGLINYAVPADHLDALTDDIVARLLTRSAYALAWTKRAANKRLVEDFILRHDVSAAYEMVSEYQAAQFNTGSAETLG